MKKITFIILFFSALTAYSQGITVTAANTTTNSVQHIVQNILIDSPCAQVSNFQVQGLCGVGSFNYAGSADFFSGGMILRCGTATASAGQYSGNTMSSVCSSTGDAELLQISQANGNPGTINDVTSVKFTFVPFTDNFSFNFVFASNEYGTYQCGFSDVFAFILKDETAGTPAVNLAVIPNTNIPVSVTNIRDNAYNGGCPSVNPQFFDTFNVGLPAADTFMNLRGFTVPMTAFANVIPNHTYTIKLVIGDYNDTAFDSAVFIEAGSFNVGTANLSYQLDQGIEFNDMVGGFAMCPGTNRLLNTGLNPAVYQFVWKKDNVVIPGATGATYLVTEPGTYCVEASVGTTNPCIQSDCIVVEFLPSFGLNQNVPDLFSCTNNFNLNDNLPNILSGLDPNETWDVLFFSTLAEAMDPENSIQISPNQVTTQPTTTFYASVSNFNYTCSEFTQFDAIVLDVDSNPVTPPDLTLCDDISGNGIEVFDLTQQTNIVLGTSPSAEYTISYHTTLISAQDESSSIVAPDSFSASDGTTVYVRMEHTCNPAVFGVVSFDLHVLPLPVASIGASTICSGSTGVINFTGTPGATVTYTVDGGANEQVTLDGAGTFNLTTPVLTASSTYALVSVQTNPTAPSPSCSRAVNGTATVTVLPSPVVTITGQTVCSGQAGAYTISATNAANATITYDLDGVPGSVTLDASGNGTITTAALSNASICELTQITTTTTPVCTFALTENATIDIIALPTVSATGNTVCSGSDSSFTLTGTADAIVTYTINGGASSSVTLPGGTATIGVLGLTADAVLTLESVVSATTPACTTIYAAGTNTATITVVPLPTAAVSGSTTICDGTTATVSFTGPANGTIEYLSNGSTATVSLNALGQATIAVSVTTLVELVSVTTSSVPSCSQTVSGNVLVEVLPLPTASVSGTTTICDGDTALITFTGTANATVNFTQNSTPSSITLDALGTNSLTVSTATTINLVSVQSNPVAPTPSCTQNITGSATVTVLPLPTASVSATPTCSGDDGTFSITGTAGSTVNYTLSGGATGSGSTTLNASGTATVVVPALVSDAVLTIDTVVSASTPSCTAAIGTAATLAVLTAPVISPVSDIRVCDTNNNGIAIFNLTPAVTQAQGGNPGLTVTVHVTPEDADFSSNPLNATQLLAFPNNIDDLQTLHIRVENAAGCYSTTTFDIIVDPRPELNTAIAPYELCDVTNSGDGVEVFDLTSKTSEFSNQSGLTYYYYENQADALANTTANSIATPMAYSNTSMPQTIWVTAVNAASCIHVTSFELIVHPLPVITPLNPMNGCSNGISNQASFDLTLNSPLVTNNQPGYIVSYYASQAQADAAVPGTELLSPYVSTPATVYVRVQNATTGCYATTTLQLNVTQGPVANTPTPLTYCDPDNNNYGVFDLTQALNDISAGPTPAGVEVTFHLTPEDAEQGTNDIDTTQLFTTNSVNQIIYIRVSYALTGCANFTQLQLIVNPTPELEEPSPLEVCDDNTPNGLAQFNLTLANAELLNGIDPATVTISYYTSEANAVAATGAISSILGFQNTVNPQTIWVRVAFNATGCFSVVPLDLIVNPKPIMPAPEDIVMRLCDTNNTGDEREFFDLNGQIPNIVNGQVNMNVTFHFSFADAMADSNPLASPYQNQVNGQQSIFARVENALTGCFDVVIMDLIVQPLPTLIMPTDASVCSPTNNGIASFDLTTLLDDMLNGATTYTVTFHYTDADAQTGENDINPTTYINNDPYNPIIYVRAVDNLTGCFNVFMFTLTVSNNPTIPELDPIVACDTNYDGFTFVDISGQSPIIAAANPSMNLEIRYYESAANALNGTSPIIPIWSYFTNTRTIWVVATNTVTGCQSTGTFEIQINVPITPTTNNLLALCDSDANPNDEFTTFDLTVMNAQLTSNSAGATVTYYPSVANAISGTNAIQNPNSYINVSPNQTLGVILTAANGCTSRTQLTIRVLRVPEPNMDPEPLVLCDDNVPTGTEIFDLTTNQAYIQNNDPDVTFEYYPTLADAQAGTNMITNVTAHEAGNAAATPATNIIYIKVKNTEVDYTGETCYVIVEQELQVIPLPVGVADTTYPICEPNTDGVATFTLNSWNSEILGASQPGTDYTVNYYLDLASAQAGTPALPNSYTNTSNPQTVYAVVSHNTTGCLSTPVAMQLIVEEAAVANPVTAGLLDACDTDFDGIRTVDLTQIQATVLGSQTTPTFQVSYFTLEADAIANTNAIANPASFTTTSPANQTIWIRVTNTATITQCYAIMSYAIQTEALPNPVISGDEIICVDFITNALLSGTTLDSGIASGTGYTYQWQLDGADIAGAVDATYTLTTAAPGAYTVTVTSTSALGCSYTSDAFSVIQSGPAANISYSVSNAFNDNQTLTITNEGYGDYTYSLDGGPFLDNNGVFPNVTPGAHTVVVRDENGCQDETATDITVTNYPPFFTPNGDGFNDTWNIVGAQGIDNAKIYIFDRYGKLIKQISPNSQGWDGTFNGNPLPATDYWFKIEYAENNVNKEFTAHFTLKR